MAPNNRHTKSVRVWTFRCFMAFVPIALFALLEGGLRVIGIAKPPALFVEVPNASRLLQTNPRIIDRYFSAHMRVPSLERTTTFARKKAPGSLRIVVQGGSTAAGFPFGLGASPAGILQQQLQTQYPGRQVEVIQTALAAVNSYTLLDLADEIRAVKPDAVLIYAGHNEYVGIMGVGSSIGARSRIVNLLALKLSRLHLYQLMRRAYASIHKPAAHNQAQSVMAYVAQGKKIAPDSKYYEKGVQQFKKNMQELLNLYRKEGVPVYIGTLASNLRDQPPFVSSDSTGSELATLLEESNRWLKRDTTEQKITAMPESSILRMQDCVKKEHHALGAYRLAKILSHRGAYDEAGEWFRHACDWDMLRFRAPSVFNDIIRDLAQNCSNSFLVDVHGEFAARSAHGLIGSNLMLEHVHPTVEGYVLLASSFLRCFIRNNTLENSDSTDGEETEIVIHPPLLDAEVYAGHATVQRLLAGPPFTYPPRPPHFAPAESWQDRLGLDMVQGHIGWNEMASMSLRGYMQRNDTENASLAARLIAQSRPFDAQINYMAGILLMQAQRPAQAVSVLEQAMLSAPDNINARLALANAHVLAGTPTRARPILEDILLLDPHNSTARAVLKDLRAAASSVKADNSY